MLLDEISSQTKVFIDSNIFIYHFLDVSESCTNFLERVERGYIDAYTSNTVLSEVMHRLMVAEVVEKYDVKPKGAIRFIKDNPEIIRTLEKCEDAIKEKLYTNSDEKELSKHIKNGIANAKRVDHLSKWTWLLRRYELAREEYRKTGETKMTLLMKLAEQKIAPDG